MQSKKAAFFCSHSRADTLKTPLLISDLTKERVKRKNLL